MIRKIIKTATFKHSAISFAGTFITGLLGLLFYSYVARSLGPSNFGVFSLAVTTIALVASIANLGTDTGVIRFVSEAITHDKKRPLRFLKLALEIKLLIWVIVLIVGYFLMPTIVSIVFGKSELIIPLRIALVGVGGMLLSSFTLSALQAYSKFGWWSVVNVLANLMRFAGVFALGVSGILAVQNTLWIYSGVLFVLFLGTLFLLPNFLGVKNEWSLKKEFLRFNGWVAAFTAVSAIGSRLDTYLSARFLNLSKVGAYSVGVTLVSFVTQIVLALGSVVAPKLSGMQNRDQAVKYMWKLQLFVAALAIFGLVVGIPIGYYLIPLVYGAQFAGSIVPFSLLLTGQAIFLLSVPVHMAVIYYFSYPKLFVPITIFRLVLTFVLGIILIPIYGNTGAALTVLFGNISDFMIPCIWVVRKFRTK